MALKVCNGCSRITNGPPLCPECRSKRNRRDYESRRARGKRTGTSAEYRRNRARALERAGHRCEYTNSTRCSETTSLECHHINGDHHDHRPENLTILCHGHHIEVEADRRRSLS